MLKPLAEFLPEDLLSKLPENVRALEISLITATSREVMDKALYVAVRGTTQDGHAFIDEAVRRGAVAVVGSQSGQPSALELGDAVYLAVEDERLELARIAASFYGHPSRFMKMIGVTGTSGKTTTTYIIESILRAAGEAVGLIGTVEFRSHKKRYPSTHTTPGPVELQKILAEMKSDGCTAVVMEVSSHALKQHRTAGIAFDGMVFLNLSPEHLDFHPDMEDYFKSKARLFESYADASKAEAGKSPVAVINMDDDYGQRLYSQVKSNRAWQRVVGFGLSPDAQISGAALEFRSDGFEGEVHGIGVQSNLVGRFNASNVLAALSVCRSLGASKDDITRGLMNVQVPGRLERVPNTRGVSVFVDYAHKPGALEKVLETLSALKGASRLITVFGCGGDRDRTKRPKMGEIAARLSDLVWVTSDNPRTENPDAIVREILEGTKAFSHVQVEIDRKKAIFEAISEAQPGDLVLIAGKGHENYQIVSDPSSPGQTQKIHLDDREVAAEAFAKT